MSKENQKNDCSVKEVKTPYLNVKEAAMHYGEYAKCKWLDFEGMDFISAEMIITHNFLREMEAGSIKDVQLRDSRIEYIVDKFPDTIFSSLGKEYHHCIIGYCMLEKRLVYSLYMVLRAKQNCGMKNDEIIQSIQDEYLEAKGSNPFIIINDLL